MGPKPSPKALSFAPAFAFAMSLVSALSHVAVAAPKPVRMRHVYDPNAAALQSGPLMHVSINGQNMPHLSSKQYEELKSIGVSVLQKFPPHQYYYIGIGRSPSVIVSMFQNLASAQAPPEE